MTASLNFPIFDGHNDALMGFSPPFNHPLARFFERNTDHHIDLPRIREGKMGGGMFAVFIEDASSAALLKSLQTVSGGSTSAAGALDLDVAQRATMQMIANLYRLAKMSNGQMQVVTTADELDTCLQTGVLAAVLHFEGAEAIGPNLDELEVYYQAGLRSLGIVWSRPTLFAEGVPFIAHHTPDTGPGLTDLGKALVKSCNELGIVIDLSHLNEKGFWDVVKISNAPLVATHSNAWSLVPVTRNLTDKQLQAIKEAGGMVGVNLVTLFLNEDVTTRTDTSLETIVRHFDYLIQQVGIDHVGLGADMSLDDVPIPDIIKDVAGVPKIFEALAQAGYGESELRKLAYENWARVLRATWKA